MSLPENLMERKNNNLSRIFSRGIISGFIGMILIVSCTTTSGLTAGDNIQPQPSDTKPLSNQIIIKFRGDSFDPSPSAFVQQLSRDAAATLAYLRPMSGGAHVFGLKNIADTARIKEIVRKLQERPDILYVEQDDIMRHLKKQPKH